MSISLSFLTGIQSIRIRYFNPFVSLFAPFLNPLFSLHTAAELRRLKREKRRLKREQRMGKGLKNIL